MGGWAGAKFSEGDVDGEVKGDGRAEEAKTAERGGTKPGRKMRHERGSNEGRKDEGVEGQLWHRAR